MREMKSRPGREREGEKRERRKMREYVAMKCLSLVLLVGLGDMSNLA